MRGQIPTARVASIIADLIEERWPEKRRPPGEEWGIPILAEKVGCHADTIDGVLRQKWEGAEFNLIDQIFCSLGRPDILITGVLSDIYQGVDLRGDPAGYIPAGMIRCERIGCGALFTPHKKAPKSGPHAPKFCSPGCNDASYRERLRRKHGVKRRGAYGRGGHIRRMVCPKGHDLHGDNLVLRKDGKRMCRTCNRERQRKWVADKRARAAA